MLIFTTTWISHFPPYCLVWYPLFSISVIMGSSSQKRRIPQRRNVIITKIMNKKEDYKKMILEKRILEPCLMEETFIRGYKTYSHICQAWAFFINAPDRIFPDQVREFHTNLNIFGNTLTSYTKNATIMIHKECFGRIFKIPLLGTYYKSVRPIGLKNLKLTITLNTLITNPIEKRKLPFRTTFF